MILVIGNKNYSSWSLRPWLLLSANKIPFEEVNITLSTAHTAADIAKYSASGKVPVLYDGELVVWDSLAICEYLSEQYLAGKGWPANPAMRAEARSCAAEMHSGFFRIREEMPMNCRATHRQVAVSDVLQKEIGRIDQIWSRCIERFGQEGGWLFGDFSIADCMFAPVVFRFATYGIEVSENSRQYMKLLLRHPDVQAWLEAARAEVEIIEDSEVGSVQGK